MTRLDDILSARENVTKKIFSLIDFYKKPVISISFNIPGPEKTNDMIFKAFEKVLHEINEIYKNKNCNMKLIERNIDDAGNRAFFIYLNANGKENLMDAFILKKMSVEIEETHTLGRLLDIDVYNINKKQISRTEIGELIRKCFICSKEARSCIILKRHSLKELHKKINFLLNKYISIGCQN